MITTAPVVVTLAEPLFTIVPPVSDVAPALKTAVFDMVTLPPL